MITIWHNPRCSKSRQTLALLEQAGAQLHIRKYLEDPPSAADIKAAQVALGTPPLVEMMRRGEKAFKELGLGQNSPEETLLSAMLTHPILIERPICLKGNRAVMGRPPENALSLL